MYFHSTSFSSITKSLGGLYFTSASYKSPLLHGNEKCCENRYIQFQGQNCSHTVISASSLSRCLIYPCAQDLVLLVAFWFSFTPLHQFRVLNLQLPLLSIIYLLSPSLMKTILYTVRQLWSSIFCCRRWNTIKKSSQHVRSTLLQYS